MKLGRTVYMREKSSQELIKSVAHWRSGLNTGFFLNFERDMTRDFQLHATSGRSKKKLGNMLFEVE